MKPLYLDGRAPLRVRLEGPALRVGGTPHADGRYPLRRLSRVIVSGSVEWRTSALLACLARGVPITFLDQHGAPVGYCFGATALEMPLAERLRELLDRPDWAERYRLWHTAEQRRAILRALRAAHRRVDDLRPDTVRAVLEAGHQRYLARARVRRIHAALQGMLAALCTQILLEAGLQPELIGQRRRGLDLTQDLTALLEWPLHRVTRGLAKARATSGSRQAVTAAFESAAPDLARRGHAHLSRLEAWLAELWP